MLEASTYVDDSVYRNISAIREKVHEALRDELRKQSEYIDWDTEIIETVFKKGSRKCEDKMLVIIKVTDK